MKDRITPENIQAIGSGEWFVFGSNLAGIHGAGAAKLAHEVFGAQMYKASGPQGASYAIPTKDATIRFALTIDQIRPYVDEFIEFARLRPLHTFYVTEIGCGLAGFFPSQIAPLFRDTVDVPSICLPARFWEVLGY